MVLAEKPTIQNTHARLDPELRDALLLQLSTLASVYHQLPATFVKRRRAAVDALSDLQAHRATTAAGDEEDASESGPPSASGAAGSGAAPAAAGDLLGGGDDDEVRQFCAYAVGCALAMPA